MKRKEIIKIIEEKYSKIPLLKKGDKKGLKELDERVRERAMHGIKKMEEALRKGRDFKKKPKIKGATN